MDLQKLFPPKQSIRQPIASAEEEELHSPAVTSRSAAVKWARATSMEIQMCKFTTTLGNMYLLVLLSNINIHARWELYAKNPAEVSCFLGSIKGRTDKSV